MQILIHCNSSPPVIFTFPFVSLKVDPHIKYLDYIICGSLHCLIDIFMRWQQWHGIK